MTASGRDAAELVQWFLALKEARNWPQDRAAQLLDVDQTTVSDWEGRRRDAKERGEPIEIRPIGKNRAKLAEFRRQVDDCGIEVAELLPEEKARVHPLVDLVFAEDLFDVPVPPEDRERAARKLLQGDQFSAALERYFNLQLQQRRAGEAALRQVENTPNDRSPEHDQARRR